MFNLDPWDPTQVQSGTEALSLGLLYKVTIDAGEKTMPSKPFF